MAAGRQPEWRVYLLTENPSFAVFRQPASILPARIARLGVQFDF
jgi:hypothetical protein